MLVLSTDPAVDVHLAPTSYTGADVEPYNSFTLTCVATKSSGVSPELDITWLQAGLQVDNSTTGVTIVEEEVSGERKTSVIYIAQATSLKSGIYGCVVVLSIPESSAVQQVRNSTVVIRGEIQHIHLTCSTDELRLVMNMGQDVESGS